MSSTKLLLKKPLTCNLTHNVYNSLARSSITNPGLRSTIPLVSPFTNSSARLFSTSRKQQLEYFEPPKNAPNIKLTKPTWPHYPSTEEQLKDIKIAHRATRTWSDYFALSTVRFFRWGCDVFTGYRHDESKPYIMSERKWLVRFIFLETVAGVPGMMAGMVRHFKSLRKMKRDNGWIETLLEDAYNERMHLLTFLKMAEPGWFMKFMILGAQGVFSNGFFLAYLINPQVCHRFVGYLEEEAVMTYTYAIQDIEKGRLPAWSNLKAPEIAILYWQMPEGKQSMLDLLYYVRADEAKHREIHHTLGNLHQSEDPNPFVSEYKDESKPHPTKGITNIQAEGWERKDVI